MNAIYSEKNSGSYVDDTFCIFHFMTDAEAFHTQQNSLHPSLQFTMEIENGCILTFLDVLVER